MSSAVERLILLAPNAADVPNAFNRKVLNYERHAGLLASVQRLRGSIYTAAGNLDPSQLSAGRQIQAADEKSWHILLMSDGAVQGGLRYCPHGSDVKFEDLGIASSSAASPDAARIRKAVEGEIAAARTRRIRYAEFGAWFLAPALRSSYAALQMVLTGYALSELLGGCLVISTANTKCSSASTLLRIGGGRLQYDGSDLGSYFDPQYNCDIQILRFDSACPNGKYKARVQDLIAQLPNVEVITAQ